MDNPFTLFGLAPHFVLDESHLTATFRSLQRAVHPDRYVEASDQERRWAVERAAAVNEAYQILRDPAQRARCLLALKGISMREEENTLMDRVFLQEQMELRERLGEAHGSSHPLQVLTELKDMINQRRASLLNELAEDLNSDVHELWLQAMEKVRKLRFFDRLLEEVVTQEEPYLDVIPT